MTRPQRGTAPVAGSDNTLRAEDLDIRIASTAPTTNLVAGQTVWIDTSSTS